MFSFAKVEGVTVKRCLVNSKYDSPGGHSYWGEELQSITIVHHLMKKIQVKKSEFPQVFATSLRSTPYKVST